MAECGCKTGEAAALERRALWALLAVNATMFVGEAFTGWLAQSTGLAADSLDMLADASVYGITLWAVGRSHALQTRAAAASGTLQVVLGVGVLLDVGRRYLYGSEPVSGLMMSVGAVALIANLSCLAIISKHRHGGVHMRASWIFSTNDVIANLGVIISGVLVRVSGHRLPDLIIGGLISVLVLRGGLRILVEVKAPATSHKHSPSACNNVIRKQVTWNSHTALGRLTNCRQPPSCPISCVGCGA